MSVLDAAEKTTIQTAAFCGYIMLVEKCNKQEALQRMAQLCTAVQVMLGLGDKEVRRPK